MLINQKPVDSILKWKPLPDIGLNSPNNILVFLDGLSSINQPEEKSSWKRMNFSTQ